MTPTSALHQRFEQAFAAFRQALWVFLVHKVPQQEAEDLFQTVCLQTYRAFLNMADPTRLKAMAFTIARRRVNDYYRQAYGSMEVSFEKHLQDVPVMEAFSPEKRFFQQTVVKVVAKLEDPYREVALLHFLIGLTAHEIAEVLDVKKNTVKSHINRSKLQIFKDYHQKSGARHATA